jgi:gas vesicle protein
MIEGTLGTVMVIGTAVGALTAGITGIVTAANTAKIAKDAATCRASVEQVKEATADIAKYIADKKKERDETEGKKKAA